MTTGYRAAIAASVKAQLLGKTIAGTNVLTSLDRRLDPEKDLPAVMVYTMASHRGREDYGQSLIPRLVTVGIECAVLADPGQELAAAEAFADQIETAMDADRTLGKTVNNCIWQQSISDVTSHGARTMGVAMLQYEVDIFTNQRPDGFFEFHDDGFTAPPRIVTTSPDAVATYLADIAPIPEKSTETACGPNGCNIPDWHGEV